MRKMYLLLVVCLFACASAGFAADCGDTAGDYVIRLSGFGGGSPVFYPIAMTGTMTVDKNGDVTGSYKVFAPISGGTKESRSFTGKLSIKACVGTLQLKDGVRVTHTFTVQQGKETGSLTLAIGDIGLILSGSAEQ